MKQEKKEIISGEREITTVTKKNKPPKIMGAVIMIGAVIVAYYVLTGGQNDQPTSQQLIFVDKTHNYHQKTLL
ncbi:MAG TPA: hypothetical protein PKC68_00290 [Alphaproteobacteria bacterium]|nr:hypothetical protein [Alphaproteobacteria bacterium]